MHVQGFRVGMPFFNLGSVWFWHLFCSISRQKELRQIKWNFYFSFSFYEETAETTIWWNVNINLQSVHFYDPQVQNKWVQKQVFMSLTSVSNILQLKNAKVSKNKKRKIGLDGRGQSDLRVAAATWRHENSSKTKSIKNVEVVRIPSR